MGKSQFTGTSTAFHAFRTSVDQPINAAAADDLGTPLGYSDNEAVGINDFDEVVGTAGGIAAVLWLGHGAANTAYVRLYVVPSNGYSYCGAKAINYKGVVIGWRWSGVYARSVPVLWWNNSGYAYDLQNTEPGQYYLPNVTTVGGGSWSLQYAAALNDDQWIVGWGNLTKNGVTQPHAYLLKPN